MKRFLIAAAAGVLALAGCRDHLPTFYDPPASTGPRIYYSVYETTKPLAHIGIDPDGTNRTRIGGGTLWSAPAHGLMAYTALGQIGMISAVDGSGEHQVADQNSDLRIYLSPDATQIAWRSAGDSIVVADSNGANAHTVTHNLQPGSVPAFSPDGSKLAFIGNDFGVDRLYVISDIRSGQTPRTRIVADNAIIPGIFEGDGRVAWSPNGTRIAFPGLSGSQTNIFVVDAVGGNLQDVSAGQSNAMMPAWAPDGVRIAYSNLEVDGIGTRDADIWITEDGFDGGIARENITNTPGPNVVDMFPAWSPDGNSLLYGVAQPYYVQYGLSTINLATRTTHVLEAAGVTGPAFWLP